MRAIPIVVPIVIAWMLLAWPAQADPQLRRVVLSTGGVGQFEFEGEVEGAATLQVDVKLDQVDDVLKSLVVDDPAGPMLGLRLPGRQPLSESFRTLPFQPEAFASAEALLAGLVGEQVRIPSTGASGAILAVSAFEVPGLAGQGAVTRHRLTVATAAGIDSVVLEDTQAIEFGSEKVRAQIATALSAIAAQRVQDRRTLQLSLAAGGKRHIRFAYVVQVPVWKMSYRLTLPPEGASSPGRLQAYAVVENLSGRDWHDVSVVLTSGQSALFHTPLYEAIFSDRPEAPVDVPGRLAPPVDAFAALAVQNALPSAPPAPAPDVVPPPQMPIQHQAMQRSFGPRRANMEPAFAGAPEPPPPPAEATQSVAQVAFHLAAPVTASSGQSLLLPILDRQFPVQRLSLFQKDIDRVHPLAALRITNDSPGALPPGLVTLFETHKDGSDGYLGDARLPPIQPGEDRVASFAADLAVSVDAQMQAKTTITSAIAARGVLVLTRRLRNTTSYAITTPKTGGRLMLIQQPRQPQWTVVDPTAGVSVTPDELRITRGVPAGATTTLDVITEIQSVESRDIQSLDSTEFHVFATGDDIPPALRAAMQHAASLQQGIDQRQQALQDLTEKQTAITSDQLRVRQNLVSVPPNSALHGRYLAMMQSQEDDLAALQDKIDTARKAVETATAALKDYLSTLNL